jgi:hypothetical protein
MSDQRHFDNPQVTRKRLDPKELQRIRRDAQGRELSFLAAFGQRTTAGRG